MMKEQRKNVKKKKNGHSFPMTVFVLVLLFLCSAAAIIWIEFRIGKMIDKYDKDQIISGVSVGETDVSGMTKEEALAAVEADMQQYASVAITLTLADGNSASASLSELGISVHNLEEIVENAVDYGKTGTRTECYKILKKSEQGEAVKNFPIRYEVTEESAGTILHERLDGYMKTPENARLTQENGQTTVVEDVPGEQLDIDKTVANINALIGTDWNKTAVTVTAEVAELDAEIQSEDLENLTDVLGTFTTYYGDSSEGRKKNVESGAAHIGGTLVQPGQEVSANELMSPYTEENGYAMAPAYENGEVVDSMGGGICQVSTTLYNALILSEIEIVERYAHSMLVSYVEPSMDAAIATDVKDLKFRNNKEDPVYIEAVTADGNISFYIYGKETRPSNRTIAFESETIEEVESDETRYVATNDSIGEMYRRSAGKTGLNAQLWKIVYEDGEEVSRDTVNYSQYRASGETIAVGVSSDNEAYTEKMKEAVATQDESKIKAAIAEIQAAEVAEQSSQEAVSQDSENEEQTETKTDGE